MSDVSLYCSVSGASVKTFVAYVESYDDEFKLQLLAQVGGMLGGGNFETEWIVLNFDADGNPINAVVGETENAKAITDVRRSYLFDQEAWQFNLVDTSPSDILDAAALAVIQSTTDSWILFDDADQLTVTPTGTKVLGGDAVATGGDVDEDHLSWLSKVWSLKSSF